MARLFVVLLGLLELTFGGINHLGRSLSARELMHSACPNGWLRYQESCYYVERYQKRSFDQAQRHCNELDAGMFVANSQDEFVSVVTNAPPSYFTWIGIFKDDEHQDAQWAADEAIEYTQINWLNKPFGDLANGWSTVSKCAAHYNSGITLGKYTFFYPCNYEFYYICEKNTTIGYAPRNLL